MQKLGLYKNKLKHLARELEKDYGLKIVSNERQPHDRARIARRSEVEESRRLGTDVREIRTAILDSLERSDNGKAFKAALEGRGFVLANGDRRDCFVVIDACGRTTCRQQETDRVDAGGDPRPAGRPRPQPVAER